ncbi:conjugative transposon protein TraK [Paraflavitalea sp. CAU 1676]|uniref:conjugative transposon protein TraK n=1 Tax=Paraflavitalea sp. CAU 1676 TaxID=3032598 RepID=UPI0023DC0A35|nr:conjugative transposon protein TraK [Paraflavitalea sp. CAU 1676]MDF2190505.1 conjugative transposon protein TraK [Paraflavitalea sp. CAU 1676]
MFQQLKNIDTAFKYVRLISVLIILASTGISIYSIMYTMKLLREKEKRIFVIANGKVFEAFAEQRGNMWPIEIRDHVKMFHFYFYTLQPDEKVIKRNIDKSLHLADNTASKEYDNLRENGYYTSVIAASISQEIEMDSVEVDINKTPWRFTYRGKLKIIRSSSIVTRSLITEGTVRVTQASDNNPHGLQIERWHVLENKDLIETKR